MFKQITRTIFDPKTFKRGHFISLQAWVPDIDGGWDQKESVISGIIEEHHDRTIVIQLLDDREFLLQYSDLKETGGHHYSILGIAAYVNNYEPKDIIVKE
jgi:hypothetical protein